MNDSENRRRFPFDLYVTNKQGDDDVNLIELVNMLWCKRKVVFFITFIFAVGGLFIAFFFRITGPVWRS